MKKQEICRALERASGTAAFITATQLTKAMGLKTARHVKEQYLKNIECVDGKYYFIPDVAEALLERR